MFILAEWNLAKARDMVAIASQKDKWYRPGDPSCQPLTCEFDDCRWVTFSWTVHPTDGRIYRHLVFRLKPPRVGLVEDRVVMTTATWFGFTGVVAGDVISIDNSVATPAEDWIVVKDANTITVAQLIKEVNQ